MWLWPCAPANGRVPRTAEPLAEGLQSLGGFSRPAFSNPGKDAREDFFAVGRDGGQEGTETSQGHQNGDSGSAGTVRQLLIFNRMTLSFFGALPMNTFAAQLDQGGEAPTAGSHCRAPP